MSFEEEDTDFKPFQHCHNPAVFAARQRYAAGGLYLPGGRRILYLRQISASAFAAENLIFPPVAVVPGLA